MKGTYLHSKEFRTVRVPVPKAFVTSWHRLFLGPALALAVIVALALLPTRDYCIVIIQWILQQGKFSWLWLSLFYMLASMLFLPKTVIALSSGFLFGIQTGFFTAFFGCLLGSIPSFVFGRKVARTWIIRRLSNNPTFQAMEKAVRKHGFSMILLCRLNPIFPFGALNYIAGATQIRFGDYLAASFIGFIPLTLIYVYIGAQAQSILAVLSGSFDRLSVPHYFVLALVLVSVVFSLLTAVHLKRTLKDLLGPIKNKKVSLPIE